MGYNGVERGEGGSKAFAEGSDGQPSTEGESPSNLFHSNHMDQGEKSLVKRGKRGDWGDKKGCFTDQGEKSLVKRGQGGSG